MIFSALREVLFFSSLFYRLFLSLFLMISWYSLTFRLIFHVVFFFFLLLDFCSLCQTFLTLSFSILNISHIIFVSEQMILSMPYSSKDFYVFGFYNNLLVREICFINFQKRYREFSYILFTSFLRTYNPPMEKIQQLLKRHLVCLVKISFIISKSLAFALTFSYLNSKNNWEVV